MTCFIAVKWQRPYVTTTKCRHFNPCAGRTPMTEYARQNKTHRYGDKILSKVDNKRIRAGCRHCSRPVNNSFGQIFVQNTTRNSMYSLTYRRKGMKTVKHYQQRHQNDVKTMFWWFYCQLQTRSTHSSSAPFFHSEQTNAGNADIV